MLDIKRERVYACSAAVLWRAIASQEGLSAWLMPCDFQPVLGHEFTFRTDPVPGFDGIVHARVLELVEPELLRLSWCAGNLQTELSLRIESLGPDRARLRLRHSGFEGLSDFVPRIALGLGWRKLLRRRLPAWIKRLQEAPA